MKNALIYYSISGQTKFVADSITRMILADEFKVQTKEFIKPNIIKRYMGGIKQMRNKNAPLLLPNNFCAENYDNIYIGTPTWNASPPPALLEFIKQNRFTQKNVYLFGTYLGRGGEKCLDILTKELSGNKIICKTVFSNPKGMNHIKLKKKLLNFLNIE